MSSPELLAANVRLGWLTVRHEYPPLVYAVGVLVPELLRLLVYCLVGYLVGGVEGMRFAVVGCAVLAVASACVAHMSDVPMWDVWSGTYPQVALGRVPPVAQYAARGLPMAAQGGLAAVVAMIGLPVLTGQPDLVAPLLAWGWVVLPAVFSASMLGLAVIAPALGSRWDTLTYNGATAVLTVVSGALFAPTVNPVVAAVGAVLPLRHAITALRHALAGRPFALELALELAVGLGWAVVAVLLYRWQDARGRRRGVGAFAS